MKLGFTTLELIDDSLETQSCHLLSFVFFALKEFYPPLFLVSELPF